MRLVKRLVKWIGLVLLVLVLGMGATVFFSFHGLAPIEDGQKLDGVQVVKDGIVACYLVDLGPGELALVDAGNDAAAQAVLAALATRGLGPTAVKAILLTHGDFDHTSGALAFPQARVLALEPDIGLAEGKVGQGPSWLLPPHDTGVRVTQALHDGDVLALSGVSFRVFSVPGHSKGSAAILARGVLFIGDSAESASDGTLASAKRLTSDNPSQNRASLVALARTMAPLAAEVQAIAPGHSGLLIKGLAPLTDYARSHPDPAP